MIVGTEFLEHYTTRGPYKYLRTWKIIGGAYTDIGISYLTRDNNTDGRFLAVHEFNGLINGLLERDGLKEATNKDFAKALLLGFKK